MSRELIPNPIERYGLKKLREMILRMDLRLREQEQMLSILRADNRTLDNQVSALSKDRKFWMNETIRYMRRLKELGETIE